MLFSIYIQVFQIFHGKQVTSCIIKKKKECGEIKLQNWQLFPEREDKTENSDHDTAGALRSGGKNAQRTGSETNAYLHIHENKW